MKEYFVGVMSVVMLGGLIISLFPEGGEKKYLRLLCAIASLSCMIMPLTDIVSDGSELDEELEGLFGYVGGEPMDYDEIYNNSLASASVENAEIYLKNLIISELGADFNSFDVRIISKIESDKFYIESVEVTIYPSGMLIDPHRVKKTVSELLGCDCVIFYE